MRALVIDDEPVARLEMRRLLKSHPQIEVVGEAENAGTALDLIAELGPDLLFLDIQMPGTNGFELLDSIPLPVPRIIFCTAYDAHALRAFEVNAIDYLLKPVDPARLSQALLRLAPKAGTALPAEAPPEEPLLESDRVLLKNESRSWLAPVRSIWLLTADGNYTHVHFDGHKVLLNRSLQSLERRLPKSLFFRVSRSQIVNLKSVVEVGESYSGGMRLILAGGTEISISRRQATVFRKQKEL
ncbi:response regulator transcription factor [Luteolibacter yonseiensis]|uniref:Response regulator transcription factor n=1 Tax=Luteolibacter yonseiensis TaxID=1144680 RepID=A0A934QZQ4_9BACT|nr:LytTR family DNA-binding domain-containing protein [Luteolibacter yonseiensis]MBK1814017.1 response regulator transcription factor [Luteolibacter yonseiensis]